MSISAEVSEAWFDVVNTRAAKKLVEVTGGIRQAQEALAAYAKLI